MALLEPRIYRVSELTAEIKALLEDQYGGVWVEGEISNFRHHTSGHMYFTLKDERAQIRAVMFRGANRVIRFRPEDGLSVLVTGRLTVYEPRGEYQINVEYMEPKGYGALQLAFEQLKERLAAEGLFATERKRPLPLLPRTIGIVTSPTGAAIRDMLQVLRRRFANVRILIYPARVQGEGAAQEIVAGIEALSRHVEVDVIIVGRGGGSIEDLWAFNEEAVARAIYASSVPVISAVGHETDFTIADFVADLRAPTPSAAAELVVSRKAELSQRVDDLAGRLEACLRLTVERLRGRVGGCERQLTLLSPLERLRRWRERLRELSGQLTTTVKHQVALHRGYLQALTGKLDSLSPLAILRRGYSICTLPDKDGVILKSARSVEVGNRVAVRLGEGDLACRVESRGEP